MPSASTPVIDSKERVALKSFRAQIPDILVNFNEYKSHDLWLLRWLRARELNLNKAEDMLRKHLAWRIKENIDSIRDFKIPDVITQRFLMQAPGFDKDDCFVGCVQFGKWDMRKILSLGYKAEFIRCVDLAFEQMTSFAELRSTKDKMMTQFSVVIDFEGFSLGQVTSKETIECILEILRRFEANYPEVLKVAYVVNAPKIFEMLFALVKPLLTARTLSKIQVYGCNSDHWRSVLLENIEPDQLPSKYGGTNTTCPNFELGGDLDFPIYEVFPDNEFTDVIVEAGGKHVLKFDLSQNSKLSWNFRSVDYDIGVSLLYSKAGELEKSKLCTDYTEVLFETARADAHLHLQKGAHVAVKPGTYYLVFNNTFSRFRKKNIVYSSRVN